MYQIMQTHMLPQPLNWLIRLKTDKVNRITQCKKYQSCPPIHSLEPLCIGTLGIKPEWWTNEVLVCWPETKPPTPGPAAGWYVVIVSLTPRARPWWQQPHLHGISTTTFVKKNLDYFLFNRNLIVLWLSLGELVNTASENLLRYFPIHSLIKGVR